MAYNKYFPFNTEQAKTLVKLLAEAGAVDLSALQQAIEDLEQRVEALEAESGG